MSEEIRGELQAYYEHAFPAHESAQISDLVSLSTGWECDVYAFDAEVGPAAERLRERLIVRIYLGDDAYDKSAREFRGMSKLHKAGYPVPEVLKLERGDSPFGKPFVIMERIDGRTMSSVLSSASAKKRRELMTMFCQLLVRLPAAVDYPLGLSYHERPGAKRWNSLGD